MMRKQLTGKIKFLSGRAFLLLAVPLFVLFAVSQPARAQDGAAARVTLDMQNATLGQVLDEIESQTKFNYIIRTNDLDLGQKVSVSAKDKPLAEVLETLLRGKDVTFEIKGGNISIYKPQQKQSAKRRVSGVVVDTGGNPVAGASVVVKGTMTATITGPDGSFSIEVPGNQDLEISFIGYAKQTVRTVGRDNLMVTLAEDIQMLDDVVVIGYGTLSKKELTSAISHVSSDQFLGVGGSDPLMQIQGKVAGLSISNQAAGDPNQAASVQLRGISSREANNSPLIVIDGVPGGNMMNVNENDIASIDVLKDGAASAIYGTRGSNGVILITTKKGAQDGKFHTSYTGYASVDLVQRELRALTSDEFRAYRVPDGQIDYGYDTDWFDAVSRNGTAHKHTLTVSGGNNLNNYRASFDFRDSRGIDLRSKRQEYGGRITATHTTKNKLLKFTANIAPRFVNRKNSSWAVFKDALTLNPTMPIKDPNDPIMYYDTGVNNPSNLVEKLKLEQDGGETKYLNWDATVKLNLLPVLAPEKLSNHYLDTHVTAAQQVSDSFNYTFCPSTSTAMNNADYSNRASRAYSKDVSTTFEWLANYTYDNRVHRVRAMAGYSYQYFVSSALSAENADFDNDGLTYNSLGNGMYDKVSGRSAMKSSKSDSKLIAFFGRVTYDYKERYLATASLRYEGSSRFGANHKWGYFPAASVGWAISEEPFMKNVKWINQLKLRADIGVTGNQEFGNYVSLSTMRAFGTYYYMGQLYNGWGWAKNVNPDLKWEKGVNKNIGIDFSLLDNRLGGSLNYYHRKQSDMLGWYDVPVPPHLFDETFVNVGTMKNEGFEIDLNIHAVRKKDFSYNITFAGSYNYNEFLNFSNELYKGEDYYDECDMVNPNNPGSLQRVQIGQSVGNYYTYAYAGVDEKGDWLVWNKDNTRKIPIGDATPEDKRITGNGMPKYNVSLTNEFRYKNFDLSIFLRGAFGFDLFNVHDFYFGIRAMEGNVLRRAYIKNSEIEGSNQLTDYFIEKGDYLKLDVVSLGYTFKKMDAKWINGIRVYVTGRNLYTFTKFTGIDPSVYQANGIRPGTFDGGNRYYPSAIQLLLGLQIDF